MAKNEFKTPEDKLGELEPPRPESEILDTCFPETERERNAAGFCQLPPDAPVAIVQERLYMNLIYQELWLQFGIKDIGKATAEQVGHCIGYIKSLDDLKNKQP